MPVDVLLHTSYRLHRTVVSLNTVIFFFGISTLPPTVVFPTRTTLHLRAFLYALITWKNFKSMFFLLLMKNIACYVFGKYFFFSSYFSSQMKFRGISVKEKKISIFNFFSLMIHIIFTPPLPPGDKIQQIKVVKTALLLQSNIPTVTGVKLSFGISLQQCRLLGMSVKRLLPLF